MTLASERGKGGSKPGPQERTRKRGGGFRRPSEAARKHLGNAAATHGFAEPEVLLRWSEIVGEGLSGLCMPVKVTYPRDHGLAATLIVCAEGARAPEVAHLEPRIIERVNQFYGYRAIGRLKLTQTTGNPGFAEPAAAFTGAPEATAAEPGPEAKAAASRLTNGIENPELRAALTRMGAHILARNEPEKT
ncbi:MAG: DciA family protein [Paracoccaceae bacterium]|nr:DciA family protein [Paracoccaceae bacterium]